MPQHRDDTRLSSGDALFLYLEREGMPLNVASVSIFEGHISLQGCSRFIESKLPLIPRYRQRIAPPPFGIGAPRWEFDPEFDIRHHVHQVTLKHGTDAEVKAIAGAILSTMLDRRHPLWDFTLIHGLQGDRTAIVTRMHHCLADGLAGVSLMNALMDASSEVRPLPRKKAHFHVPEARPARNFVDELILSSVSLAERILTAQKELFQVFEQVLASASQQRGRTRTAPQLTKSSEARIPSMEDFARLMPEVSAATQLLPFNVICRGPQKFGWTEIPLADLKAVKQACGATVNEVALTIITSTIQRYVESRGVRLKGRLLRIVVPVNVRGNGSTNELGNRITFVPITIPLDIRSLRRLVSAIRQRTAFLKSAHVAECVGLFGTMLGTIPTPAQQFAGQIVSQIPLGLCNLIFTNVPGPTSPLYLLGHKLVRCYPYVPIGGELGINCAMLTYDGTAYFGFTADVHAVPDVGRLERFLLRSFSELWQAVGLGPRRTKRPPAIRKAAAPDATTAAAEPPIPSVAKPTAKAEPAVVTAAPHDDDVLPRAVA